MPDPGSVRSARVAQASGVLVHLSWLDRLLPLWILLAMAGGLLLGQLVPGLQALLDSVEVDHTSLPIALSLLLMMDPVLAKVRYGELGSMARDRRLLTQSRRCGSAQPGVLPAATRRWRAGVAQRAGTVAAATGLPWAERPADAPAAARADPVRAAGLSGF
jgi:hypothetical protein